MKFLSFLISVLLFLPLTDQLDWEVTGRGGKQREIVGMRWTVVQRALRLIMQCLG